jgi:hypothetical protein
MKSQQLLIVGILLIGCSLLKPNFLNIFSNPQSNNTTISAPTDPGLLQKSQTIIDILQKSTAESKTEDCTKLSNLYNDLATLISLDGNDTIIKDTVSIREANILAAKMLKIDIRDKYPDLAEALEALVLQHIGNDDVVLDTTLRQKSVEAFRSLSWAFYKGA